MEFYEQIATLSNQELFTRVWNMVTEFGEEERHFNGLQSTYRSLASTWLLATFGAVGFLLSERMGAGKDSKLLIAAVGLASCLGIALLWTLDLLVYHRLLQAVFAEGVALEKAFGWLPPFRQGMLKAHRGGVLRKLVWFYLGSCSVGAAISATALGAQFKPGAFMIIAPLAELLVLGAFVFGLRAATLRVDKEQVTRRFGAASAGS
jgi:hypothetical protein